MVVNNAYQLFFLHRWAVVKDETVFNKMVFHMQVNSIGVSKDTQLRAFKLLKAILEEGSQIFDFAYQTMKSRWERLTTTLSLSNRFSLQKTNPQYCFFYNKVRESSPGTSLDLNCSFLPLLCSHTECV